MAKMPFTLYAAGADPGADIMIRKLGYNRLLSQLNERPVCDDWVSYLREHPECESHLFIDSGAFTAHTKGKEVDVDDYINYLNSIDDVYYIAAQVDHIPGVFGKPKTEKELLEAPELSWKNYLYMKDKVKSRDKLLPIYHQGEDIKWLKNILEYRHEDGSKIWYCGISPANDVKVGDKVKWLEQVFEVIKNSSNPEINTHAFGMTSLDVLEQFPFTSADSTAWLMEGITGGIKICDNNHRITSYYVSESNVNAREHLLNQPKVIQEEVFKYMKEAGFTIKDFIADTDDITLKRRIGRCTRLQMNIFSLNKWLKEYKLKEELPTQYSLW